MTFRKTLILIAALSITLQPSTALAQSVEEPAGATKWRRWAGAAAGALLMGGVASFTDQAGEQSRTGACDTTGCVVAVGALIGGSLGYLLGSEWDRRVDRRAREGPTLEVALSSVALSTSPTLLAQGGSGVFALTRDHVFYIDDDLKAQPILAGFSARAMVVSMDGTLLLLASSTEVVGVPLPGPVEEPVSIVGFGVADLESAGEGAIITSEPGRMRRFELSGSPFSPSLLEDRTVATVGVPAGLRVDGNVLWTLEDSSLIARNAGTLEETGRVQLPGRAAAFTLSGPTALVALGNAGAVAVDVSNPTSPRITYRIVGMDFALDAAVLDGRVYVAAGAQGVFVYELNSEGQPVQLGVVRDLDFAGDLLVRGNRLYILDRSAGSLYRL